MVNSTRNPGRERVWVALAVVGLGLLVATSAASARRVPADRSVPTTLEDALPDDSEHLLPAGRARLEEQIRTARLGPVAPLERTLAPPAIPPADLPPGSDDGLGSRGDLAGSWGWIAGSLACFSLAGVLWLRRRRATPIGLAAYGDEAAMIRRVAEVGVAEVPATSVASSVPLVVPARSLTGAMVGSPSRTRPSLPQAWSQEAEPELAGFGGSSGLESHAPLVRDSSSAPGRVATRRSREAVPPRAEKVSSSAKAESLRAPKSASPKVDLDTVADGFARDAALAAARARARIAAANDALPTVPDALPAPASPAPAPASPVPAPASPAPASPAPALRAPTPGATAGIDNPVRKAELERMMRLENSVLTLAETIRELSERIPQTAPVPAPVDGVNWESRTLEPLELDPEVGEISAEANDPGGSGTPEGPSESAETAGTAGTAESAEAAEESPWEYFLAEEDPDAPTASIDGTEASLPLSELGPSESPSAPAPSGSVGANLPSPASLDSHRGTAPGGAAPGTGAARSWVRSRSVGDTGSASRSIDLEAMRDEVLSLAAAGVSVPEICDQVGLGRHEVQLILRTLFSGRHPRIPAAELGVNGR